MSKYARQIRVIGRDAQAKLESSEVIVARSFAGSIEAKYLAGAGMRVREGDATVDSDSAVALMVADARFDDMHPAARDVALGAHAAVRAIFDVIA